LDDSGDYSILQYITVYSVPVGAFCMIRTNLKFHFLFDVKNSKPVWPVTVKSLFNKQLSHSPALLLLIPVRAVLFDSTVSRLIALSVV
jgi:hypothetical protein